MNYVKQVLSGIGVFVAVCGVVVAVAFALAAAAVFVFCTVVGCVLVLGMAHLWDIFDRAGMDGRAANEDLGRVSQSDKENWGLVD